MVIITKNLIRLDDKKEEILPKIKSKLVYRLTSVIMTDSKLLVFQAYVVNQVMVYLSLSVRVWCQGPSDSALYLTNHWAKKVKPMPEQGAGRAREGECCWSELLADSPLHSTPVSLLTKCHAGLWSQSLLDTGTVITSLSRIDLELGWDLLVTQRDIHYTGTLLHITVEWTTNRRNLVYFLVRENIWNRHNIYNFELMTGS